MGRVCDEFSTGRYWPNQSCGCAIQSWNSDHRNAVAAIRIATVRLEGFRPPLSVLATRS